jgi:hypothetical protein
VSTIRTAIFPKVYITAGLTIPPTFPEGMEDDSEHDQNPELPEGIYITAGLTIPPTFPKVWRTTASTVGTLTFPKVYTSQHA